jgi:murein L,D-transpeptidase YafK
LRRSTLHERLFWTSRLLLVSGVIAAAAALAGCNTDFASMTSERALRPLSSELAAEMEKKNMPKESPILVRIFKEESEFEVWKQDANGQFALLRTYPICRWSGELGPKVKEGDRQAPEGFYAITPGQMNPNSNYYLAFNLGFPNAFDRANDRSGAFLMVHGDCSSAGCYAMTDEQIQEIYTLGRDAFLGGQKSFQVQAYPFHMTSANLARHRNNPAMSFWRNIKEGNDHFMVSRAEPKVDVCEKHYVFDAEAPAGSFHGREKCPTYTVKPALASAVKQKEQRDDAEFEALVNKGVATVAVRTGIDGGMHPTFLAKLRPQDAMFDNDGHYRPVTPSSIPLPAYVNPPHAPTPETETTAAIASAEPKAKPAGMTLAGTSKPAPTIHAVVKLKPDTAKPDTAKPEQAVAQVATPAATPAKATPFDNTSPPPASGAMTGAAPVVSSSSFEGRWGGMH